MATAVKATEGKHASASEKPSPRVTAYWERRKDSIYLHAVEMICRRYAGDAQSVIDVGSNGTPTLEWHRRPGVELVSLDFRRPYIAPGVTSVTTDFLKYNVEKQFDLATCFQVLEHVPDVVQFAQKLLSIARTVIVSVPYKWKQGSCKHHVHDPVDEVKMAEWFNKEPRFSYIAHELNKVVRLVHVYR